MLLHHQGYIYDVKKYGMFTKPVMLQYIDYIYAEKAEIMPGLLSDPWNKRPPG